MKDMFWLDDDHLEGQDLASKNHQLLLLLAPKV